MEKKKKKEEEEEEEEEERRRLVVAGDDQQKGQGQEKENLCMYRGVTAPSAWNFFWPISFSVFRKIWVKRTVARNPVAPFPFPA